MKKEFDLRIEISNLDYDNENGSVFQEIGYAVGNDIFELLRRKYNLYVENGDNIDIILKNDFFIKIENTPQIEHNKIVKFIKTKHPKVKIKTEWTKRHEPEYIFKDD